MKKDYTNYSDVEAVEEITVNKLTQLIEIDPHKVAITLLNMSNFDSNMNIKQAIVYTVLLLEYKGLK